MGDDPKDAEHALDGLTVHPDDLQDLSNYIDHVSEAWNSDIVGYISKTLAPLADKVTHAAIKKNPHGDFYQADNLHTDVGDAQRALQGRAQSIGQLLTQLAEATDKIARNYQDTESDNAAGQRKIITLLDSTMSASAADPAKEA